MSSVVRALLFALIPGGLAALGGTVAALRAPSPRLRSYLQHFAAGVIFSIVSVELMPDVMKLHHAWEVAIGFGAGVAAMLGLQVLMKRLGGEHDDEDGEEARSSATLLVAVGVDVLIDGLLIGLGFALGAKEGVLLAVGIGLELLAVGLATSATLQSRGVARGWAAASMFGVLVVVAGGAVVGALGAGVLNGATLQLVLSFGLAALLYLVTEELLVEAHEVPETPLTTAMFFVGFLAFLILGMVT